MTEKILEKQKQTSKQKLEPPKQYAVVIMNDDFTPMEFVIEMLMKYFSMPEDQANRVTQDIHTKGKGHAGTFSKDIAETKASLANDFAQSEGHPLHSQAEQVE